MTAVWQAIVHRARLLAAVVRRAPLRRALSDAELAEELEFAERVALLRAEMAEWLLAHPGHTGVIDTGRGLTAAEEEAELERLRMLAERRRVEQAQLVASWGRLPEQTRTLLVAAGAAQVPASEPHGDRELQAEILRRERELVVLRLRGMLRASALRTREPSGVRPGLCRARRFGRSPRRSARARSCARTQARPRRDEDDLPDVAAGRR